MSSKGRHSLLYFDIRGRGECIRLLFKHAGVEFEDRRIQFNEWPALQEAGIETPVGFLPVLTTPCGVKIFQTIACLQYVADELGLFGSGKVERGLITAILTSMKELHDQAANITVFAKDEEDRVRQRPKHEKYIINFFKYFQRLRDENKESEFLVGKTMTVADIFFIDVMDSIEASMPGKNFLDDYLALKKLDSVVRESENLKKYLAERK